MKRFHRLFSATQCVFVIALVGCGSDGAFSTVPVSGKISYEDGSLIPANSLSLRMRSLAADEDPDVTPRVGNVYVDVATGELTGATTYRQGDGIIGGKHKFSMNLSVGQGRKLTDIVPRDYISAETTPLVVDTADMPWHIKVPKP